MKFEEIEKRAAKARQDGQEIIVVLGLGFVGTAVVANLARTLTSAKKKMFFVVGLDRDDAPGREKVSRLDGGRPPTYANDPSLEKVIAAAAVEPRNAIGSTDPRTLSLADVVISCINLDVVRDAGQTEVLKCPTDGYAAAMRTVGEHMQPGTLVCVESTLPLGMSDRVIYPALCEGQKKRGVDVVKDPPLLAYCYERVMPGPDYLDSVNNFWRAFAGIDAKSSDRAQEFLSKYVNIEKYPLWRHKTIRAAEMGKLLENSYRATNIAFIEEWAMLAERVGVDLFDIVRSIRLRKGTHDNMMLPGLGVGGYCLTKDALLAAFGAETLLNVRAELPFSRRAILTNEKMPLRAVEWIDAHFQGDLKGKKAALIGVTYRPGVADTRSSPSEIVARALAAKGVEVRAYDPLVEVWEELPEIAMSKTPESALDRADIVVVCLPDAHYKNYLPELLKKSLSRGAIVVDPWTLIADQVASDFAARGIELKIYGRGDAPAARSVEHRKR